jgi:aryl-alcohol dehydrogenase-like predicted oxidoreductase
MEYVRLGTTGLKVSPFCLGMMSYGDSAWRPWTLSEEDAEPFIRKTADAGINFFDTADAYSGGVSEEVTGRLLKKAFGRREDYVLATKVFFPTSEGDGVNDTGLSRAHIMAAVDASLRRLDVDHIDLYQIHRWDPETPIAETMEALHDVVRSGKVRYIGASSMKAWQFAKAQHTADLGGWTRFVTMQNHYNLLYREEEREMIPQCVDMGVGVIPWSPLGRGVLARPRSKEESTSRADSDQFTGSWYETSNMEIVDAVEAVSKARGVSMAQVALAWHLANPAVTAPIVGATKPHHVDEALGAFDLELTQDEITRLEAPYQPRPANAY